MSFLHQHITYCGKFFALPDPARPANDPNDDPNPECQSLPSNEVGLEWVLDEFLDKVELGELDGDEATDEAAVKVGEVGVAGGGGVEGLAAAAAADDDDDVGNVMGMSLIAGDDGVVGDEDDEDEADESNLALTALALL